MTAPTDEQLLALHLEGDVAAFRTLADRYAGELFRFVYRFTNSKTAADDIVQDAFLQVHLSATNFDPARKLKPWLFTIAANKARDHLRSRTRRREVPLDAPVGSEEDSGQRFRDLLENDDAEPADRLADDEKRAAVRDVVGQMPPHLAEILILAYYHHFAYREIADVLQIPLGTVKSRLHAAVAQFGTRYRTVLEAGGREPK